MLFERFLNSCVQIGAALTVTVVGTAFSGGDTVMAQSNLIQVDAVIHGEALAKRNCNQCHAIGLEGKSPHSKAPPFRELSSRTPVGYISYILLLKASPEHSDMPRFTLTTDQADDLVAWISWVQPVAHGKRLVVENCSRCHAVGLDDDSIFPAAPPFRNLSIFYPIDALEEAFAERIETGHPSMPVFEVSNSQLRDMLAYMKTLQKP